MTRRNRWENPFELFGAVIAAAAVAEILTHPKGVAEVISLRSDAMSQSLLSPASGYELFILDHYRDRFEPEILTPPTPIPPLRPADLAPRGARPELHASTGWHGDEFLLDDESLLDREGFIVEEITGEGT